MARRATRKVRKKVARKTRKTAKKVRKPTARKKTKKRAARKAPKKAAARAPSPKPAYVRDVNVIDKDATTREERRAVLASALANDWAAEDIGGIERIDKDNWHGWEMTPRP